MHTVLDDQYLLSCNIGARHLHTFSPEIAPIAVITAGHLQLRLSIILSCCVLHLPCPTAHKHHPSNTSTCITTAPSPPGFLSCATVGLSFFFSFLFLVLKRHKPEGPCCPLAPTSNPSSYGTFGARSPESPPLHQPAELLELRDRIVELLLVLQHHKPAVPRQARPLAAVDEQSGGGK